MSLRAKAAYPVRQHFHWTLSIGLHASGLPSLLALATNRHTIMLHQHCWVLGYMSTETVRINNVLGWKRELPVHMCVGAQETGHTVQPAIIGTTGTVGVLQLILQLLCTHGR